MDAPDSQRLKFLWLGHSNDNPARPGIAPGARRPELMARMLEERVGRPVRLIYKPIWPEEALPAIVERWMEREQPDVVWLNVAAYWVCYESTPKRVKRWFGRLGGRAGDLGERAGQNPWLAERRLFRAIRTATQAALGGDPVFAVDEVAQRIERCARAVVRAEDRVLVIEAPRGRNNFYATRAAARRGEQRRQRIHQKLRALAAELHCGYVGSDSSMLESSPIKGFQKDGFHMDAANHAMTAEMDFPVLVEAVAAQGENWLSDSFRGKLRR